MSDSDRENDVSNGWALIISLRTMHAQHHTTSAISIVRQGTVGGSQNPCKSLERTIDNE